jgi:hypothetical protein
MVTEKQQRGVRERWSTVGKLAGAGGKGGKQGYKLRSHRHTPTLLTERAEPSLVIKGWVGDKPCLVTIDTGAYATAARPDTAVGWPEKQPDQRHTLHTLSGEPIPILKEVFLTLDLVHRPLKMLVFVATITNNFFLGLDIQRHMMHLWTKDATLCILQRKRYHYGVSGRGLDLGLPDW